MTGIPSLRFVDQGQTVGLEIETNDDIKWWFRLNSAGLPGCTDSSACNYDQIATIDDDSCDYSCLGCTDSSACNYDAQASVDDGSCLQNDDFAIWLRCV